MLVKRKSLKNKILKFCTISSLIISPTLFAVSCSNEAREYAKNPIKFKRVTKKLDVTYNSHEYKINYFEEPANSDKQVVLFLHGFGASWTEYESLIDVQNRNYTIIALDYPGNGQSPYDEKKGEVISMGLYAGVVNAFIKAKKLSDLVLFGHSLGGGLVPLVMEENKKEANPSNIKKGLMLAPFNPYTLSAVIDYIRNTDKDEEMASKIEDVLDRLKSNKNDPNKSKEDVLNTTYKDIEDLITAAKGKSPLPWYEPNIEWISGSVLSIIRDSRRLNYNMMVNELLSLDYAHGTLKDAFKNNKDKLACLNGEADHVISLQSVTKMHEELGIDLEHPKDFGHRPQTDKKSWDIVKKFILDHVAEVNSN